MRRRVTRRLTRLQTMRNFLTYSKLVQNGSVRLRFGCGYFFQFTYFSTVFHQPLLIPHGTPKNRQRAVKAISHCNDFYQYGYNFQSYELFLKVK